jgi:hypothetical protein
MGVGKLTRRRTHVDGLGLSRLGVLSAQSDARGPRVGFGALFRVDRGAVPAGFLAAFGEQRERRLVPDGCSAFGRFLWSALIPDDEGYFLQGVRLCRSSGQVSVR